MAQDEYVIQKRYTLRGISYSGSFPVTVTDYIHCSTLLGNIKESKINDLLLSEGPDLVYLERSSFLSTFGGYIISTFDGASASSLVNTGITTDIVL